MNELIKALDELIKKLKESQKVADEALLKVKKLHGSG